MPSTRILVKLGERTARLPAARERAGGKRWAQRRIASRFQITTHAPVTTRHDGGKLAHIMASFVRIALAGAGSFAKMEIRAGDDIADLAERACAKFPSWKADSTQLFLYLVAAGGDEEPDEEAISAALSTGGRLRVGRYLKDAGISAGAWLVARKVADGGAKQARRAQLFLRFSNPDHSHISIHSADADGRLHPPQRGPHLLSPYAIGHVALSALQATHHLLAATVLRVGNIIFSATSGMENVGLSSPRRASPHESRILDGRQPLDCNVGGNLPRRVLSFGLDSGESGGGPLKEE